uniref:Centrosomal protein POC5 n=1 Tax=Chromera velia CCMP2878 TaxID=1169474 RepID=A0A0G4FSY5_9ALVE|eukprot:Cvel_18527.t1-p1 / transcript=Cvel_18527.t1 / gene=Cvel_18527 / organism=Chromera_velia_CCMP2878 / gene_product=Centrosomal protein POC5, putative / transcript_product=Centrosomal protein POC5, putative / location=Cvel_scaffold1540:28775-31873(+) / protein_length=910 / sequence_SO=supercontig / SO=protein_coding / is_pseudo=false
MFLRNSALQNEAGGEEVAAGSAQAVASSSSSPLQMKTSPGSIERRLQALQAAQAQQTQGQTRAGFLSMSIEDLGFSPDPPSAPQPVQQQGQHEFVRNSVRDAVDDTEALSANSENLQAMLENSPPPPADPTKGLSLAGGLLRDETAKTAPKDPKSSPGPSRARHSPAFRGGGRERESGGNAFCQSFPPSSPLGTGVRLSSERDRDVTAQPPHSLPRVRVIRESAGAGGVLDGPRPPLAEVSGAPLPSALHSSPTPPAVSGGGGRTVELSLDSLHIPSTLTGPPAGGTAAGLMAGESGYHQGVGEGGDMQGLPTFRGQGEIALPGQDEGAFRGSPHPPSRSSLAQVTSVPVLVKGRLDPETDTVGEEEARRYALSLDALFAELRGRAVDHFSSSRVRLMEKYEGIREAEEEYWKGIVREREAETTAAKSVQQRLFDSNQLLLKQLRGALNLCWRVREEERGRQLRLRVFSGWQRWTLEMREKKKKTKMCTKISNLRKQSEVFSAWMRTVKTDVWDRTFISSKAESQSILETSIAAATAEKDRLERQLAEAREQIRREVAARAELQESLKRVFMRGVCALNFEAMSLLSDPQALSLSVSADPPLTQQPPRPPSTVHPLQPGETETMQGELPLENALHNPYQQHQALYREEATSSNAAAAAHLPSPPAPSLPAQSGNVSPCPPPAGTVPPLGPETGDGGEEGGADETGGGRISVPLPSLSVFSPLSGPLRGPQQPLAHGLLAAGVEADRGRDAQTQPVPWARTLPVVVYTGEEEEQGVEAGGGRKRPKESAHTAKRLGVPAVSGVSSSGTQRKEERESQQAHGRERERDQAGGGKRTGASKWDSGGQQQVVRHSGAGSRSVSVRATPLSSPAVGGSLRPPAEAQAPASLSGSSSQKLRSGGGRGGGARGAVGK